MSTPSARPDVNAYAQWVSVHLVSSMLDSVTVKNTKLPSGKFYRADNKDEELEPLDIDQIKIPPGGEVDVNSCGRENVASGTEGSFEVYKNDDWVCSLAWDCPCGSKTNSFDSSFSDDYWITVGPWNTKSGAIGTVKVEFGEHRE